MLPVFATVSKPNISASMSYVAAPPIEATPKSIPAISAPSTILSVSRFISPLSVTSATSVPSVYAP